MIWLMLEIMFGGIKYIGVALLPKVSGTPFTLKLVIESVSGAV